jgi:hypothetical protein
VSKPARVKTFLCLDCLAGCSTQAVAYRDRRMDRFHTVRMYKYKAKDSFSLRQISLIFLGRFCALNFSVLPLIHRNCMLRAKMDFRPIVAYLSMKDMNAKEISADMNNTLGADCIGYSTVTKYPREKVSRSRCLTQISRPKLKRNFIDEAMFGVLKECPFSSLHQIAKRLLISMSPVRCHLVNSLGYRIRNIRWVLRSRSSTQKQTRVEMCQDLLQVLRLTKHHAWKYIVTLNEAWFYFSITLIGSGCHMVNCHHLSRNR